MFFLESRNPTKNAPYRLFVSISVWWLFWQADNRESLSLRALWCAVSCALVCEMWVCNDVVNRMSYAFDEHSRALRKLLNGVDGVDGAARCQSKKENSSLLCVCMCFMRTGAKSRRWHWCLRASSLSELFRLFGQLFDRLWHVHLYVFVLMCLLSMFRHPIRAPCFRHYFVSYLMLLCVWHISFIKDLKWS